MDRSALAPRVIGGPRFSRAPVKWWVDTTITRKFAAELLPGERVLVTAIANNVLGYFTGYGGGTSTVFTSCGKAIAMTDHRILLADIVIPMGWMGVPLFWVESPVPFARSEVYITSTSGPSRRYPFTHVTLLTPGGQDVELRFTPRWEPEVDALEMALRSNTLRS